MEQGHVVDQLYFVCHGVLVILLLLLLLLCIFYHATFYVIISLYSFVA